MIKIVRSPGEIVGVHLGHQLAGLAEILADLPRRGARVARPSYPHPAGAGSGPCPLDSSRLAARRACRHRRGRRAASRHPPAPRVVTGAESLPVAVRGVQVRQKYGLTVGRREAAMLEPVLVECPTVAMTPPACQCAQRGAAGFQRAVRPGRAGADGHERCRCDARRRRRRSLARSPAGCPIVCGRRSATDLRRLRARRRTR